nr:unnamed protein product [Spirometra erinaceieuropaei]
MVPKATSSDWRPCGDYRALSNVAIPDRHPVPHLGDFAGALFGKAVFSKTDLVHGFPQIPVVPEDIPRIPVITPFGLLELICMSFGLRNAAQTLHRFIDRVLHGLPFVYAYVDDLLVASQNAEEHKEHLALVLNRLDKYDIVINPSNHVHLDVVGPLPPSNGYTQLITCVDRYDREAEALPLPNVEAETIVKAFVSRWVAMFGAPATVTTDRGAQFESALF